MAAAQAGEIKYRCEYRLLATGGRVVWVLAEAVVVRDADGRPVSVQGVAPDITEGKRAEAEAASTAREVATLHRISEIVRAGRPLDEAYAEITAEVEALVGFRQSAIALFDESRDRLVYKGAHGLAAADGVEFEADPDSTFSGRVVRAGRPLVWTDGEPFPGRFPDSTISHETRTFVGVPMTVDGRVIEARASASRSRCATSAWPWPDLTAPSDSARSLRGLDAPFRATALGPGYHASVCNVVRAGSSRFHAASKRLRRARVTVGSSRSGAAIRPRPWS
jgi:PAS fold/GAF domain